MIILGAILIMNTLKHSGAVTAIQRVFNNVNPDRRIHLAEQILLRQGFTQFRVRSHGDRARIEVLPSEQEKLFALRKEIHDALRALGFSYVTADLYGFRSGSLNETL